MTYSIEQEKLKDVVKIFNNGGTNVPLAFIEQEICADWNEGKKHQEWIDWAMPEEIADWLKTFI